MSAEPFVVRSALPVQGTPRSTSRSALAIQDPRTRKVPGSNTPGSTAQPPQPPQPPPPPTPDFSPLSAIPAAQPQAILHNPRSTHQGHGRTASWHGHVLRSPSPAPVLSPAMPNPQYMDGLGIRRAAAPTSHGRAPAASSASPAPAPRPIQYVPRSSIASSPSSSSLSSSPPREFQPGCNVSPYAALKTPIAHIPQTTVFPGDPFMPTPSSGVFVAGQLGAFTAGQQQITVRGSTQRLLDQVGDFSHELVNIHLRLNALDCSAVTCQKTPSPAVDGARLDGCKPGPATSLVSPVRVL